MPPLKPGDRAPDFSLSDQDNKTVSLSQFLGKKFVVLYFYPKDFTMGCTAEACAFRDDFEVFSSLGAEVIGVSADSPESHKKFREKNRLPFMLLTDPQWEIAALYGVDRNFGIIPGRVSFIIDKEGVIRHSFKSQFRSELHKSEAMRVLKEIAQDKRGG